MRLYAKYGILNDMSSCTEKPLIWLGSSLDDLRTFPEDVKDSMGHALHLAQAGDKHHDTKPLKGFGGASVLEVVERHDGDTFRAVYTVRFAEVVYVLHAFQKKSKSGIKTPKEDLDLIQRRFKQAEEHHRETYAPIAGGKNR